MGSLPLRCARSFACSALVLAVFAGSALLKAQTAAPDGIHSRLVVDRITQPIDEHALVTLRAGVHPLAKASNDRGRVPDAMKLDRLQVLFKRSDAQEAALKQTIADLHNPTSASYHKWLTPEQFGRQFGPSDADVAKVEGWLQSHGFSINRLNPGRQTLEISGNAAQFRAAFHTELHSYQINKDQLRYANVGNPLIPAALAPVFGGFASLNNFPLKSLATRLGSASYDASTHKVKPSWTVAEQYSNYFVISPADYAVQYDLNPLYTAASPLKGDGQAIAVISDSNIDVAVSNRFRTLFNLPPNPVQVVIDGTDPGVDGINDPNGANGGATEAYLDVEWAGAVAPDATIYLVTSADTATSTGYLTAAARAVYSDIAPIIAITTTSCEQDLGSFGNTFWESLYAQAAAQGITVVAAAGDSGSAACDDDSQSFAVYGTAVNGLASTPYNVAIGGTDFYYSDYSDSTDLPGQLASYWNTNPTNTPAVSLQSPIPEQVWNDSQYGLNINGSSTNLGSGGGGPSLCGISATDNSSCSGYPKPSWQVGTGVPADGVRDLPDISLLAPDGLNLSFFPICANDGDCQPVTGDSTVQITGVGGTSVGAPSFSGMMALIDQKYGPQGQAGYILYPLAASKSSPFNDVVNGNNSVPCNIDQVTDSLTGAVLSPADCIPVNNSFTGYDAIYGNSAEGQEGFAGSPDVIAYNAGPGYDLATGLGSVDAAKLVAGWGSVQSKATAITMTPSSTSFSLGTTITLSGTVSGNSPTGNISIFTSAPEVSFQGQAYAPIASDGTFSITNNYFPGGTYKIWAYYPGDSNNSPSTSTPVTITVSPATSVTILTAYAAGAPVSSGTTFTYGQALNFVASPQPPTSLTTAATGSVVFLDNSAPVNTATVNSFGYAAYNAALSAGSHSITAAYAGDGSYTASTSSPFTVNIAQATASINYQYFGNNSGDVPGGQVSVVPVWVESNSQGGPGVLAPTGAVTVVGGPAGATGTGQLVPGVDPNTGKPASVAVFTIPANAPLGSYNVVVSYPGDTNYLPTQSTFSFRISGSAPGFSSSITASTSQVSTSPSSAVQVTATVTGIGGYPAPTGYVEVYAPESSYSFDYAQLPTSDGTSATVTFTLNSSSLPQGTYPLLISYDGDDNYRIASTTVTVDNSMSDFSLLPDTTLVTVPATGVVNDAINVTSFNGFAGNISLACSAGNGLACSIPPSATLTSGGTVPLSLTINGAAVTKAGTYNVVVTATDSTGAYVHTLGFQVVSPVIATHTGLGPVGNLELAVDNSTSSTTVSQAHGLFVSGWAADPTDGAPLSNVKVYIDGVFRGAPNLNIARPDVATYFNKSAYTDSGFNITIPASGIYVGVHTAEVIATDAAGFATTLGFRTFTVAPIPGPPLGNLEVAVDQLTSTTAVSQQHNVFISGWVADPVDGSPLSNVQVYIDNVAIGAPSTGIKRPDVALYYRNQNYLNSGYHRTYYAGSLTIGSHSVTVTATDVAGHSTTFGPLAFTVAAAVTPPVGNLENAVDSVTGSTTLTPTSTLFVSGWAADYHDNGPAKSVQVFIDGAAAGYAALGKLRPDVASYYNNSAWTNTGWSFTTSVAALSGPTHTVIAVAKDSQGLTTTLGPLTFTIGGIISTVAGNGTPGYNGDNQLATAAELQDPGAVARDSSGNLYIADTVNGRIRKVDTSGNITTFAGGGTHSEVTYTGPASGLSLNVPEGVAVDKNGNVYISDTFNYVVRMVTADGMTTTTVAGNGTTGPGTGDGGAGSAAQLGTPDGIAVDSNRNLYIADPTNNVIRKVTAAGIISTVAGTGTANYTGDGGAATAATLNSPFAVAVDSSFNLYIADANNNAIRAVTAAGVISTLPTSMTLLSPFGVAVDSVGNVYAADTGDNRIVLITPQGVSSVVAGTGVENYSGDGGPAIAADLYVPYGVATDSAGNLYIADTENQVVRKVTF